VPRHPRFREPLPPPTPAAPPPGGAWAPAAIGLRNYGLGLTCRMVFVAVLVAALGVGARTAGLPLIRFVAVILPLVNLASGVIMIAGLIRFSRQPTESPARATAGFATAIFAVAFCIELIGFFLILQVIGIPADDFEALDRARDTAALAERIAPWAIALGFTHILALLVAFRRAAVFVEDGNLARRAVVTGALVAAASAAFLALTYGVLGPEGSLTLALRAAVVGLTIAAIVLYLGLIQRVARTLIGAGERARLPRTEVVS
jgi:hypothetical protein